VIASPCRRKIACGYVGSPPGTPHCDVYECLVCAQGAATPGDIHHYNLAHVGVGYSPEQIVGGHLVIPGAPGGSCVRTLHAEENAILNATFELKGSTLYTIDFPCYNCAKKIAAVGIDQVYYQRDRKPDRQPHGRSLFDRARIRVVNLVLDESTVKYPSEDDDNAGYGV
jgi:deoxycytidylate deaminase